MLYIAMIVSRPCTHARQFLGNLNSRDRPRCLTRPEIPHLATRMATVYGTVSEFNPATDEWSEYVEDFSFTSPLMESKTIIKNAQYYRAVVDRRLSGCYGA